MIGGGADPVKLHLPGIGTIAGVQIVKHKWAVVGRGCRAGTVAWTGDNDLVAPVAKVLDNVRIAIFFGAGIRIFSAPAFEQSQEQVKRFHLRQQVLEINGVIRHELALISLQTWQ